MAADPPVVLKESAKLPSKKASGKRSCKEEGVEPVAKRAKVQAPALVVFGLGNVGEERVRERHNVGHRVAMALTQSKAANRLEKAEAAVGAFSLSGGERPWLLLPPQGHINESGSALRGALEALGHPSAAVLVIVDDVALPVGTIRLRAQGSSGGHNGLKSIEAQFGANYHRLKVGIGGERSKDHVVGEFSPEEESVLKVVVERAREAVELWLSTGPEEMQKVLARVNHPDFCRVGGIAEETAKDKDTTTLEADGSVMSSSAPEATGL
mmetsp:Transcript_1395/g.3489  ORF Transcript_1395/g.3489 Transcript_1395/m.3489 type:complete len:268 (+) Transcript_1395:39-842(+)